MFAFPRPLQTLQLVHGLIELTVVSGVIAKNTVEIVAPRDAEMIVTSTHKHKLWADTLALISGHREFKLPPMKIRKCIFSMAESYTTLRGCRP
jgi:hypothetical protein